MQSDKGIALLLGALLTLQTALLAVVAYKLNGLERLLLELQSGISSVLALRASPSEGSGLAEAIEVDPGDGPARGNPEAPVTIVEFSDFSCPACAALQPVLGQILQQYDGQVRLAFRHFPLRFQGKPLLLARAAECGHEQGSFWPLHDLLFARNGEIEGRESLHKEIAGLGFDQEAFMACLDSDRATLRPRADFEAGLSYGVDSTPTLFINGRRVLGNSIEEIKQAISASLTQPSPAETSQSNQPLESNNLHPAPIQAAAAARNGAPGKEEAP